MKMSQVDLNLRQIFFRVKLVLHSIPRYLLYYYYGYGRFHITPLRYKKYLVDVVEHINKRIKRDSILDIDCGIGDVLLNAAYAKRVGLDHNSKVLDALRFRSRFSFRGGPITAIHFSFGVDLVAGVFDVIVLCNWIHNVEPNTLRSQFEQLFSNHRHYGGELIFDTVQGEHYPPLP